MRMLKVSDMKHTVDPSTTFVTRKKAAQVLDMSPQHLANLASEKRGPRFSKLGDDQQSRTRYRLADVIAWGTNPLAHEAEVWGRRAKNARRHKAGK